MGGPSSGRGLSGRVIWVAAAFAALLAVTVVLAMEVRALRPLQSQVRRLRAFPHPGEWVPTVTAVSITGDSVVVGETTPGRAQLLVFFTTTCEFCKASLDSWKEISAALAADSAGRFDVLWISASKHRLDEGLRRASRHSVYDCEDAQHQVDQGVRGKGGSDDSPAQPLGKNCLRASVGIRFALRARLGSCRRWFGGRAGHRARFGVRFVVIDISMTSVPSPFAGASREGITKDGAGSFCCDCALVWSVGSVRRAKGPKCAALLSGPRELVRALQGWTRKLRGLLRRCRGIHLQLL